MARCLFTYTPDYPDSVPEVRRRARWRCTGTAARRHSPTPQIKVESIKGLSGDQCAHIEGELRAEAEANLGMALVYTVCESVRNYLVENNVKRGDGSMYDEMMRRQREEELKEDLDRKREEAEAEARAADVARGMTDEQKEEQERKVYGTLVSRELFDEWRRGFEREMEEYQDMRAKRLGHTGKPTGKDMFELAKAEKITVAQASAKLGSIVWKGDDDTKRYTEEDADGYGEEADAGAGASRAVRPSAPFFPAPTPLLAAAPLDEDLFVEDADVDLDELDDDDDGDEEDAVADVEAVAGGK